MLFNSGIFAIFFVLFFPLYLLVRTHVRARNTWLLIASYIFYGAWNPRFVPLLAFLAAVDYMAALGVAGRTVTSWDRAKGAILTCVTTAACLPFVGGDGALLMQIVAVSVAVMILLTYLLQALPAEGRRRAWLLLSIVSNLGALAFFKYFNFLTASVHDALEVFGWHTSPVVLHIILPVGLSFHVFQGISRTVDCHRSVIRPEGSLTTVATYLAFFPQLVAGPIERAAHLIPQFESVRPLDRQMLSTGALLFVWGLFQKVVVADNVAGIADGAFGAAHQVTGGTMLAGVIAFTIQIYCDFCGYSNMARGLARCLGFELMANFNLPYFARTPSEFWRRWHISLSSWLRDYLYIALGGNRGGQVKMYRNLMLTMLLGGLWHGAAWTFVAWGALHGAILVVYRVLRVDALLERVNTWTMRGLAINLLTWACTLAFVMVGWIFFRARSFPEAAAVFASLSRTDGYEAATFAPLLFYAGPLAVVEIFQRLSGHTEVLTAGPFMVRYTMVIAVLMALLVLSAPAGQTFIYFAF